MKMDVNKNQRCLVINNNKHKNKYKQLDLERNYKTMKKLSSIGETNMKNTNKNKNELRRSAMNLYPQLKKHLNNKERGFMKSRVLLGLLLSLVILISGICWSCQGYFTLQELENSKFLSFLYFPWHRLITPYIEKWFFIDVPDIEPKISPLLAYVGFYKSIDINDEWDFLLKEGRSIFYILHDICAMVLSNREGLSYYLGHMGNESVALISGVGPLTQSVFLSILGVVLLSMLLFEVWRRNFNIESGALLPCYECNNNYCITESKQLNVGGKNMDRYQTFSMNNINSNKTKGGHDMNTNKGNQNNFSNDERQEQKKEMSPQFSKGVLYIILGLGIIVAGYLLASFFSTPKFSDGEAPKFELPVQQQRVMVPPKPQTLDPEIIFNEKVKPVVEDCKRENEEVLRKCLFTLDERMKECYSGIDPFLDDMTSFGTKIGIVWNWAVGDKEAYIKSKFEEHIVSEEELKQILNDVVEQYIEGVGGNINEMHTRIMVNMEPIRKQFNIPKTTIKTFVSSAMQYVLEDIQNNSNKLLWNTIISYGLSEIGSYIAVQGGSIVLSQISSYVLPTISEAILTPALAMAGVNLTSTLAGVGVGTAASAGTGATIGSVIPGFGTVVGFVAGGIIGIIIENHIDNNFKEKIKPQIERSIDEIKIQISRGFRQNMSSEEEVFMKDLSMKIKQGVSDFCNIQNQIIMTNYQNLINNINNSMGVAKKVSIYGNI